MDMTQIIFSGFVQQSWSGCFPEVSHIEAETASHGTGAISVCHNHSVKKAHGRIRNFHFSWDDPTDTMEA